MANDMTPFDFASIVDDAEIAPVEREEFDNSNDRSQRVDDLKSIPTQEEEDFDPDADEEVEDTEEAEDAEEEAEDVEDDGEEVDFENYEITLPTGENTTLSELVKDYRSSAQLNAEREQFEAQKEEFFERNKHVAEYMEMSTMEADAIIAEYADFDWNRVKREDPEEYWAHRDYYEKAQERKAMIADKLKEKRAQEEDKAMQQRAIDAQRCNVELLNRIPGWGSDLFGQVYAYGIESGVPQDVLDACTDPAQYVLLHKAMQFDKGQTIAKAKVKRIGNSPTKVVKSEGSNKPEKVSTAKLMNKVQTGSATRQEKGLAFANLID